MRQAVAVCPGCGFKSRSSVGDGVPANISLEVLVAGYGCSALLPIAGFFIAMAIILRKKRNSNAHGLGMIVLSLVSSFFYVAVGLPV